MICKTSRFSDKHLKKFIILGDPQNQQIIVDKAILWHEKQMTTEGKK